MTDIDCCSSNCPLHPCQRYRSNQKLEGSWPRLSLYTGGNPKGMQGEATHDDGFRVAVQAERLKVDSSEHLSLLVSYDVV